MKKFLFSVVIFLFCLGFNLAQTPQFLKAGILKIDEKTKLWDVRIPLNYVQLMIADTTLPVIVTYVGAGREDYWGHYENGEVVMDDAQLFLRKKSDYYFQVRFYTSFYEAIYTDFFIFYAPDYKTSSTYYVNDWSLKVVAQVEPPRNLLPSRESYFSTVPEVTDSIIYGKFHDFEAMLSNISRDQIGYEFHGMTELNKSTRQKLLSFVSVLENEDGVPLLYDIEVLSLMANVEYVITHNLTGEGAFFPYLADNIKRSGSILDREGKLIRNITVQSGEPIWLSYDPSGMYFLQVDGIPYAEKIIKI